MSEVVVVWEPVEDSAILLCQICHRRMVVLGCEFHFPVFVHYVAMVGVLKIEVHGDRLGDCEDHAGAVGNRR